MEESDNIIFDFNKINITPARKYAHVIVKGIDEYKFES